MANGIEDVLNASDVLPDIVVEIGKIGLWLQAVGLIVLLWVAFQVVSFIYSRKGRNELRQIRSDLKRIEKKIDKLSR